MDSNSKSAAETTTFDNLLALGKLDAIALGGHAEDVVEPIGHKFGLPTLPIPSASNLHYRYDPVVDQVTNLLMRHGKKSVAQRVGSSVPRFLFALPSQKSLEYRMLIYRLYRTCHTY